KIIEPVHTRAVDLAKGIIQVESKYDFIGLDHLTLHFAIEKDGEVIQSGTASVSDVGARETKDVALDYHLDFEREAGTDYYVTISYMTNRAMPWCRYGHEVATAQFKLPVAVREPGKQPESERVISQYMPIDVGVHHIRPEGELAVSETNVSLVVQGTETEVCFDKINGQMTSWKKDGLEIVEHGPKLQFWRAPIDNDMYLLEDYKEKYFMHLWHEMVESVTWKSEANRVEVVVETINGTTNAACYDACRYEYTIFRNGDILFKVSGDPGGLTENAPDMIPRLGVEMRVNKECEHVRWYGRGPGESYSDSKEANLIGVYDNTVSGLFTNYVHPQENGNHTDTHWVRLANRDGLGIMAAAVGAPGRQNAVEQIDEGRTEEGGNRELIESEQAVGRRT